MRQIKTTLLYDWFNEVWNKDNENAIDQLLSHDSFAHGILKPEEPKGAEGFKLFFRDFRKTFHNINIEVDDVVKQDDMEAARTTVNAVHTVTGKNVSFTGICMVRVKDGKIAEAWNNYDFLSMYQQLGQELVAIEKV